MSAEQSATITPKKPQGRRKSLQEERNDFQFNSFNTFNTWAVNDGTRTLVLNNDAILCLFLSSSKFEGSVGTHKGRSNAWIPSQFGLRLDTLKW